MTLGNMRALGVHGLMFEISATDKLTANKHR
jgi:hypothetical protein